MLVYASCTTNSSVHESVISCTSPFSSNDSNSSDIIEKTPSEISSSNKQKFVTKLNTEKNYNNNNHQKHPPGTTMTNFQVQQRIHLKNKLQHRTANFFINQIEKMKKNIPAEVFD